MQTFRTEGIILHTLRFQDYDQILTVFTPGEGILKMMVKGAFSQKNGKGAKTAPLSRAEFIYARRKGELFSCREISMLNPHLNLRLNIELLEAASDILQATSCSQMPHKAAPDLYKLLLIYLEKLAVLPDPQVLSTSFRLKILRHDGLWHLPSSCTTCQEPLQTRYFLAGESFCRRHAPPFTIEFSDEEGKTLEELAYAQTFAQLAKVFLPLEMPFKVKQLFQDLLER